MATKNIARLFKQQKQMKASQTADTTKFHEKVSDALEKLRDTVKRLEKVS